MGTILLLFLCFLPGCLALTSTNIATDQSSLLALRAQISFDPQEILAKNWSVASPVCDWIGVTCSSGHRRVTALNISNMGLSGTLPPQLGNLSFLVSLNMSRNNFRGELQPELARLNRLKVLNLAVNNLNGLLPNCFTGLIPPSISNMSKLATLILVNNSLEGKIPEEIFNISSLEMISLGVNSLSGSLPDYMCFHLPRLRFIGLSMNKFSGQIPSNLAQCSELQALSFSFNKFTGNTPKEIGNLKKLEVIYFAMNSLTGEIPKELANLTMLKFLDLSDNNITGEIPREISNLHNLEKLNLGWNNVSGSIPVEIFNLSRLKLMSLAGNKLSGILPSTVFYGLPNLEELYLNNNNFVGDIPESISNSSRLYFIILSNNKFTGPIPISIGNLRLLQVLDLTSNNLVCDPSYAELSFISSLANSKNLRKLSVSNNPLNGILPESVGNLSTSLQTMYAYGCGLRDRIPDRIGNLSNLIILSLYNNQLTGSLPITVTGLQKLQAIMLHINKLSQVSLEYFCSLNNLGVISLSFNQIVGSIPECIGNVTSLRYLYLASNKFNFAPKSLWNLKDLLVLDLSSNSLTGPLPLDVANLKIATAIDMSKNHFSGGIPTTIGDMQNLNQLSLAHNQLQGSIPVSIGSMLSLAKLDLSRVILVLGAMSLGFIYLRYQRKDGSPIEAYLSVVATQERISHHKLLQATDGYHERNLLGKGGFGSVYKGTLDDGRVVAVKVFDLQLEGALKSFDAECEVLRNLRHRNLTKVISCCSNPDFKALVLEFLPNGSLEKWFYSNDCFLDIIQRLDILVDVASALQYLHYEYSTPVVHCDLKPSNVLLDEDMVAHVSDFGLTKLLAPEEGIAYTKTLATLCYLAPGLVSVKCDVYSLGIMMMEVFTRMNPSNEMFGENLSLRSWVLDSMANALAQIIDANLLSATDDHFLEKLDCISSIMKVALNCTRESPGERSNIQDVLEALVKIKLQLLPLV
ncbi:receptor kinase-like protein Xa21 [Coffea eugenioides]|uniref:receptor kinase-like protein Xa21 n=1 Tax=Coffea eugenioides TaxID=49369 RepID=UPI000F606C59|nr:receptor kinase-like protein Xa21 [Coffea eugenioides]